MVYVENTSANVSIAASRTSSLTLNIKQNGVEVT